MNERSNRYRKIHTKLNKAISKLVTPEDVTLIRAYFKDPDNEQKSYDYYEAIKVLQMVKVLMKFVSLTEEMQSVMFGTEINSSLELTEEQVRDFLIGESVLN